MTQLLKSKESDSTNLLLFFNDLKQMYKMNRSGSNMPVLDSFFNILTHVVTVSRKFCLPTLKKNLTEKQIIIAKNSLQKEIDLFFKDLQANNLSPSTQNKRTKVSFSIKDSKRKSSESHQRTKREISNQNIIEKIKEKIKMQSINTSVYETTQPNLGESHRLGLRSISQAMKTSKGDIWKMPGNITSRNTSDYYSMNLTTIGRGRARSRDKIREIGDQSGVDSRDDSQDFRVKTRNGFRGESLLKKSRGDSRENGSTEMKLSFYTTRLVNQYQNVIHKYYTIKTEEETKKSKSPSEEKKE